jgi:alpha-beta hydrolase superfamily lysophospholipase
MSRFRIKRAAVILLALVVLAIVTTSWLLGSELVRPAMHPVPLPIGFTAQQVAIPSQGHAIAGWWIDNHADTPVVLLLPGIRADRSSMASRATLLRARGFSVLLIDLQAHGETPGEQITLGWRESRDVEAALGWLKSRFPGRRIGVIGCSLGGASIVLGHQPAGFDAIVLEAVYPRIGRAVENRIRLRVGALAPLLTPLLLAQIPLRLHISPHDLEPIRHIADVGAPVLIAAGSRDEHTTLGESEELYGTAVQPKQLWVVDGARHQDLLSYDPAGYEDHVIGFLVQYLRPGG